MENTIEISQRDGKVKGNGKAIASLVLGIIAILGANPLILGLTFVILGLPLSIAGFVLGIIGCKSAKRRIAIAGIVLSVLAFILIVGRAAYGVMVVTQTMQIPY